MRLKRKKYCRKLADKCKIISYNKSDVRNGTKIPQMCMEKKEGFLYTRKRRRNDEFSFGGNPGSHLAAAGHVCGGYCAHMAGGQKGI